MKALEVFTDEKGLEIDLEQCRISMWVNDSGTEGKSYV